MKQTIIWMVFAALFVLTACGALSSGELVLPEAADLEQMRITAGDLNLSITDADFIAQLLEILKQGENTGRASVQDAPKADAGAIRLHFDFKGGGTSTAFLYWENGTLFLEQPYQGIYALEDSAASWFRFLI